MSDVKRILSETGGADSDQLELLLHRYLDGRLDADDRTAVETHIRTNGDLRRRFDALREEARLLREALEPISEPSRRLGDKVLAQLHQEERFRIHAQRNRRLRRHLFTGVGVAAALALCVLLIQPRDPMATALSGTNATITTITGERKSLSKNSRVYEGDTLTTAHGQFVRLQTANGAVLDLDEDSRLKLSSENPALVLALESGRAGVKTGSAAVQLTLPQGKVQIEPASVIDVWLPEGPAALWPALIEPAPKVPPTAQKSELVVGAMITVIEGAASVVPLKQAVPSPLRVESGNRVELKTETHSTRRIDIARSLAVETRRGHTLHAQDNPSLPGVQVLGLLKPVAFVNLGRQLELLPAEGVEIKNGVQVAIFEALQKLDASHLADSDYGRAEKLAIGQQSLRLACEPIGDEAKRSCGRLLEGLSHMERGRALLLNGNGDDIAGAQIAFEAARVAFQEALHIEPDSDPLTNIKGAAAEWPRQIAVGQNVTVGDLPPVSQTALLATYHHALARYWQARAARALNAGKISDENYAADAVKELSALQTALSRSVEGLSLRFAEALALEADGKREQSSEMLRVVLSTPLAGWNSEARRNGDGIKQAALLALARLYAKDDLEKARAVEADYRLAFPLSHAHAGAAAIRALILNQTLTLGDEALKTAKFPAAIERYDEWLSASPDATKATAVRLQLLEALIEAKNFQRAKLEIHALESQVTDTQRTRLQKLAAKVVGKIVDE